MPPEFSSILRRGTKVLGPIRRVRFTKATVRQASIRENTGPSKQWETKVRRWIKFKSKVPHRRSPYAMKYISEVTTLWNLRTGLRRRLKDKSDAPEARHGTLPKTHTSSKKKFGEQSYILLGVDTGHEHLQVQETDKATFFSPTNEWSLAVTSTTKMRMKENLL